MNTVSEALRIDIYMERSLYHIMARENLSSFNE